MGTLSFFGIEPRSQPFNAIDLEMLKFLGLCIGGFLVREFTEKALNDVNKDLHRNQGELNETIIELNVTHMRLQETKQYALRILSLVGQQVGSTLHGISGFTTLLKDEFYGVLNGKQTECIEQINKGANHLLTMVNDLSDLYKVNLGTITIQINELKLAELVENVLAAMQAKISIKALKVKVDLPDPEELIVSGDEKRVKQLITILVSNAVKYSPNAGQITITAVVADDNMVKLTITDQGGGIPEEKQKMLFTEFYQVDPVRDSQMGGIGIGLALARHLVELHNGTIGFTNAPEKGSIFWVTLPSKLNILTTPTSAINVTTTSEPVGTSSHRILVVDDNEMNLSIMVDMLMLEHHNIHVAKNGAEAIEMAELHQPELILMDLFMPIMDGFEATRRLRAQEKFKHLPIIAVSASADQQTIKDSLAAGCTEHLAKPVKLKHLFDLLRRIFN
jgi:signal transduction histidine kinase/CheY-like chemotaxis protein